MLVIGFADGYDIAKGYSTNSKLSFEEEYILDVIATTHSGSHLAQQGNDQLLNHTEPKLLQQLEDEYLGAFRVFECGGNSTEVQVPNVTQAVTV